MTIGTVKFYDSARGFGFISPEDGSDDVFVHISTVERSGLGYLSEGQKVEFETESADSLGARGPKAVNLFAVED
ncbi:MAG: cold-shock protein [Alphaproteobacteria bacterium]|nr:cold-shock protein [Alphaproteobacteria bacterium]MCZ6838848.1 cold-shock protein [Alphaproteobacteria bacterium]MCZ6846916.1 cold-shock protein [Alphaproteobacteria bacterium]